MLGKRIDKDMTAAPLRKKSAQVLLLIPHRWVSCLFGLGETPKEEKSENVSVEQMKKYTFPAGSMGPAVDYGPLSLLKRQNNTDTLVTLSSALEIIEGKT
ncbi:hypothetical protein O9992_24260 [Vibrio lentus]|nr:hypothetical protein [Vibrio lentus]